MSPYHGDGESNNDLTDGKFVNNTIVHIKMGVRSFKRELMPRALSVTPKYRVSLFSMYNYLNNNTLYQSLSWGWCQQVGQYFAFDWYNPYFLCETNRITYIAHCCTHLHHDGDSYRAAWHCLGTLYLGDNPFRLVTYIFLMSYFV